MGRGTGQPSEATQSGLSSTAGKAGRGTGQPSPQNLEAAPRHKLLTILIITAAIICKMKPSNSQWKRETHMDVGGKIITTCHDGKTDNICLYALKTLIPSQHEGKTTPS